MCSYCPIEPKTQIVYSIHSSLVERQLSIRGARVQTQATTIYLNLGFLYHKMKMWACNLVTNLSGHLKLAGHLENKIPQNLNAPQICSQVPGIVIITACRYKASFVWERGIINLNSPWRSCSGKGIGAMQSQLMIHGRGLLQLQFSDLFYLHILYFFPSVSDVSTRFNLNAVI